MAPLMLEGNTLGEKHKHFNKLVKDTITNKEFKLTKVNSDESDINNLLKIDTACKTKNVDYILEVFKCKDMLYVSKAIKNSTWLVTEQEYAHIINPENLDKQLFPHMMTKAINKLLLHIRLHLKDEKRVEAFYDYFKGTSKDTDKWLLNCSNTFIEDVIQNRPEISLHLYKRLCKRSVNFLKYNTKVDSRNQRLSLKTVLFLIKSNTEEYLDVLDASEEYYNPVSLRKYTDMIMKKCPNRIFNNFEKYMNMVDMSIIVKYLNRDSIIQFLLEKTNNQNTKYFFSNYDNLKHFIQKIPQEQRFQFVKNIYIDKNESQFAHFQVCVNGAAESSTMPSCSVNSYKWYQYASFNVALLEIKKLIKAENSPNERRAMMLILIGCAKNNPQNTKTLLEYYYDKHRNEPFKFKINFVINIITQMSIHEFDNETWNILDKLFYSLEVYTESENNVQICLKAITLYKILHNENIPDIVEKKMSFDTFKTFKTKLNEEQQEKLFNYLLHDISNKIKSKTIGNETDFYNIVDLLQNALNLLIDWKKDLNNYSFILEKVQDLVKIRKENAWASKDLSKLYHVKKSWRRYMFKESIMLCPSEGVCLNALKHDPDLLLRHSSEIDTLRTDDTVCLRRLLSKLRIYWPDSLAQQWIEAYFKNVNNSSGHKALISGLFVLLPEKEILDFAKKYVPDNTKIEYDEVNQVELSIRKNIARSLHIARPFTSSDAILWYANGDYLQYTVPAINSIVHNISNEDSRRLLPKLLEAPVSLQKYGLQLAFVKLTYEELSQTFSDIWKTTKNSTIRTHLFTHTYNLLCKTKEPAHAIKVWDLLGMFIDNLTANDSKLIFIKLGNAKNIPVCVLGDFYRKSYKFLANLPPGANGEIYKEKLLKYAPEVMDFLDADFVVSTILAPAEDIFDWKLIGFVSSFVLHGKSEHDQYKRFNTTIEPALQRAFMSWDRIKNDEYVVKSSLDRLITTLTWDVRRLLPYKKIIVPVKLFSEIEKNIKENIPKNENYIMHTSVKLTTEYLKLVDEHKDMFNNNKLHKLTSKDYEVRFMALPDAAATIWEELHMKICPKFGPIIVKHLKEDTEKYFVSICWLFQKAVQTFKESLMFPKIKEMEILKYMVLNEDFIPSYLIVIHEISNYNMYDNDKKKLTEIRKILSSHPSLEVQTHYQEAFAKIPT